MKTLALHYGINEPINFQLINNILKPMHQNSVFQWDFEEQFKINAMKEIQQALRMFKKKGTIDY